MAAELKCDGCGASIGPQDSRGFITWTTMRTLDLCLACVGKAQRAIWPNRK
jgi:hypothetical protein